MSLEINVKELSRYLIKKAWIVILTVVLFCFASGFYTVFCMTPLYSSSAKMYIRNRQSTGFSSSEITAYSDLAKDYVQFLYSDTVLSAVKEECGLSCSLSTLKNKISVSNPSETRVLQVKVSDADPALAKEITDSLCRHFQSFILELMHEDQITVYDRATLPNAPYSPVLSKNLLSAALIGFLLSTVFLSLQYALRGTIDSVKSAEEILQLKVIGKIPYSRRVDTHRSVKNKENRGLSSSK